MRSRTENNEGKPASLPWWVRLRNWLGRRETHLFHAPTAAEAARLADEYAKRRYKAKVISIIPFDKKGK